MNKFLIVVVGPTAIGKTKVSVELAGHFNCAILNGDSRQVFKEISIGTAKPGSAEMSGIKHYFVNDRSIQEEFSAGQFETEGLQMLEQEFSSNNFCICSGGSGLYIDALVFGLSRFPDPDLNLRKSLKDTFQTEGIGALQDQIQALDPEYANTVDLNNPQRLIRAIEICLTSDKNYTALRSGASKLRPFTPIFIGLELPREELYNRINKRMDEMIAAGLFEEAETMIKFRQHNALQTIGYKEIYSFIDGTTDKTEAIRLLKRNSRRFAKRQMTWFKKNEQIKWFAPDEIDKMIDYIVKYSAPSSSASNQDSKV